MTTFHKEIGAVSHAPGEVFEMLRTILRIRIETAIYLSTYIFALRVVGKRGSLAAGVSIIHHLLLLQLHLLLLALA
ncbi:hypothetical protein MUK42_29086 [Musa troglodytarum]|uniref:Uncharacterized protein n=1 Tax=Musa troglodytarum TaxID=320322 RepID=A0A9E7JWC1_9LILI|nr:hypothetical protein MUK42_29086 [Musa troglodytarum]